ncbi:acyltransferase family protein [Anianabacter salinae]|uniref:acyltransferase family protein n=1 Tax=Anianabacter salinae TaxID=2851023 RepID=UPI00225DF8EB|nr:acyltransferase [Anianabacter salinae]MBV0911937.1 acyltransferase [Anianabacter salinae]
MDTRRYLTLDLIRGLCAVAVACYHFATWNYGLTIESAGAFGVYIFFILSALAMMISHAERFHHSIDAEGLYDFFAKRIARILPLLMLVALAMFLRAAVRGQPMDSALPQAILTGTAAFGFHLPGYLSNAVGAWSLGIEAMFYVVFPLVALAMARISSAQLAAATLAAILFQQLLMWVIAPLGQPDHWYFYATPLTFAPFFAFGLWAWRIGPADDPRMFWAALAALVFVLAFSIVDGRDIYRAPLAYLGLSALSAIVVMAAFRARCPAMLARLAVWLGEISYALYLTHWFTNEVVTRLVARLGEVPAALHLAIFLAVAMTVAAATYRLFERPARVLIRRRMIGGGKAPSMTAP